MAYRGKHRKPTQAGKNVARVATAGVVAFTPIVATTPAHADTAPLSQLAELLYCESGGNPEKGKINWTAENPSPSSTASGAYQIIDSTWRAYGGTKYASRAMYATPQQQTEIAGKIARAAGVSQWACAGRAGFTDPSVITWSNVLKLTGEVSVEVETPKSTSKPTPPVETSKPVPAPVESAPAPTSNPYTVKSGDTLSGIAFDYRLGGWSELYAENRETVGPNPDLILPGQSLRIPDHEATSVAPAAEVVQDSSTQHQVTSEPVAAVSAALSATEAALSVQLASAPSSGYGGVAADVARAGHVIADRYNVDRVLGVGPRPRKSDHSSGLALDFMVNTVTGNALADYVLGNMQELNVKYVIWRQRINYGNGWVAMEDRGSPTENHMDHVHVSFNS